MKKPKSDFYTTPISKRPVVDRDVVKVNIKRIGDILWSKYDYHTRKLVPITDSNFDGVFLEVTKIKNLSSDIEIWSLLLKCNDKTYSFGYFHNTSEGTRQTHIGKFHNSLIKLVAGDVVKLWIDKLGEKSIKMGVTVNDNKLSFDI